MADSNEKSLKELILDFTSIAGIDKDSTNIESKAFTAGQMVRFDNGSPRKIGGQERLKEGTTEIVRGMATDPIGNNVRIFLFRNTGIFQFDILANGTTTAEIDRTPVGWVTPAPGTPDLTFTSDFFVTATTPTDATKYIIVNGVPNSENPAQSIEGIVYIGLSDDVAPLTAIPGSIACSGGVIVKNQRLFVYGNNGVVRYSKDNDPSDFSDNYFILAGQENLVAGLSFREILYVWDNTQMRQLNFNGTLEDGSLDITVSLVAPSISISAAQSIVLGNNNVFYWLGSDDAYMFNGSLNAIPNAFNQHYYNDTVNRDMLGKIWGVYMGCFKEIWWFVPQIGNTECNRVWIYKIETNEWCDTELFRSAGLTRVYGKYPLFCSSKTTEFDDEGKKGIWRHEKGVNIVVGETEYALDSYFQTRFFSALEMSSDTNVGLRLRKIEKDFIQIGDMTVEIISQPYPNSTPLTSDPFTFAPNITHIDCNVSTRFFALKFRSNTLDGFYNAGKNLIDFQLGAIRPDGEY